MFENGVVCFLTCGGEHHRVMIGHDPNATPRESMAAWFRTSAFDRSFVGVPFDPEYMVARHREGVAEDQILQQDPYR